MHKWYQIKAALSGPKSAEIYIYGNIGDRWDENGVIAADLVRELGNLDVNAITLRINSYGGSVPDGLAIYNALKRHQATVDVHVDGVAISCASYIAMAGDTVTMAKNALMMIHAPWAVAVGNAADMREYADVLDRYAKAMAVGYADKSEKTLDECLPLLMDGNDHWMDADEALAAGFCDSVGPEVQVSAALSYWREFSRVTPRGDARRIFTQEKRTMEELEKQTNTEPVATATTTNAPSVGGRTRADNEMIVAMFKPFMSRDGITDMQTAILSDPDITVDKASAMLLAKLGADASPANPIGARPNIETIEDENDKRRDAMSMALLARAGLRDASGQFVRADSSNPYRGHRLLDLARESLAHGNVKTSGMSQMEVVGAAFTQSTSDFPILLESTMNKVLQNAYAVAALTWRRFCAVGSVSDFRANPRYRVGSLSNLDTVNELGEFKNKTIPDGEKSTITATTRGNIINLSRQAIVNDDLGAFLGLSSSLGRAAARTIEADVYALLALNSGLGPTMADSYTLFHANHANITTGAALAMLALDADRVAMASQKDVGGNDYLDLMPAVLLVPISLGGSARSIIAAEYDPDTANKLQKPNIVRNMVRDVVDTPRLTGTRRYLFADPAEAPVIEVAFLDGVQDPYLEMQGGFDVDGARWKVRLDYGVGAIDYRGAVTNAGV